MGNRSKESENNGRDPGWLDREVGDISLERSSIRPCFKRLCRQYPTELGVLLKALILADMETHVGYYRYKHTVGTVGQTNAT